MNPIEGLSFKLNRVGLFMPSLSGLFSFLNRFPRVPLRFTLGFAHVVPLRGTQESGLLHPGSAHTFAVRLQPCPLHESLGFAHVGYAQSPAERSPG